MLISIGSPMRALANMSLSWLFGRLKKFLPLVALCILIFMFYSMSTRPLAKVMTTSPPVLPSLANHWIIVNTSNGSVCSSLTREFFQWTILLVSVRVVPKYSHSNCIFLSDDELVFLSDKYSITYLRPMAVAYLYAIFHGAALIYIPRNSVDLSTIQKPPFPLLEQTQWGLTFNSSSTFFDPAFHFGCMTSAHDQNSNEYLLYSDFIPALHTPVRLGPGALSSRCPKLAPAPPIILGNGSFVHISLEGSTFTKDSFWTMPVQDWTNASIDKAHWHILVQWLLWQSGKAIRIYWDSNNYHQQMEHTKPVTTRPNLNSSIQKCSPGSFESCLTSVLSKFEEPSKSLTLEWFETLKKTGYSFPSITHTSWHSVIQKSAKSTVWFNALDFSLLPVINPRTQRRYLPVPNVNNSKQLFSTTCPDSKKFSVLTENSKVSWDVTIDFSRPWIQFHDVLLIVTFNSEHYDVIPYIEILYRSFFPNILYCGPRLPNLNMFSSLRGYKLSFVTYDHSPNESVPGAFNYECSIKAIRMRYQLDGYLVISDDLILLIHPISNFPRNVIWYLPQREIRIGDLKSVRECRLGMCDFYPSWHWWEDYLEPTLRLFKNMKEEQWLSPLIHHCYSELVRLNGAEFRANGGYADIYYIPSRVANEFANLAEMFLDREIFLEITVPTIIRCLELPEDIQSLSGKQVWDLSRNEPWKYFTRSHLFEKTFLHPVKLSHLSTGSSVELVDLYCNHVIPYLFDQFARFKM